MKQLYKNRLLKLADHIVDRTKRGHKKFDFSTVTDSISNTCGTAGCAMGECPIAFPKSFKFVTGGLVRLKRNSNQWLEKDIAQFFGLSGSQVNHLFYPGLQQTTLYGGKPLNMASKAAQVRKNILAFLEKI
jgi:hypothetical protein